MVHMEARPTAARHHTKRRIVRNTSANAIAQAVSMLTSFVFVPLLLTAFGVANYGVMVLAASVASFSAILDLGVGSVLVRMVAERNARNDHLGVRQAERSAALFFGAIGVVVAATMVLLGEFASVLFKLTGDQAFMMRYMLWITAGAQVFYWPTSAARGGLSGLQRFDLVAGISLVMSAIDVAGVIGVLILHRGPVVLVGVRAVETVVGATLYVALFQRLVPRVAERIRASLQDIRSMIRSGSSIFTLTIAQLLGRQQTDKLVLGIFIGPAAVGIYEIASKMVTLVSTVTSISASAVLPVAAELNARDEHEAMRSLFLRGSKILVTIAVPVIAILMAIATPFIAAWCGPGYATVVPAAQILLLSQAAVPLYELGDQLLIAKDRFSAVVPAGLTCALLNVALSVTLVHFFGMVGVALGTLGAMTAEFPWFAAVLSRELGQPIPQWIRFAAWPLYPLLVVPVALAYTASRMPLGGSLMGLAVIGAAALGIFWLIATFIAYSKVERHDLLSILYRQQSAVNS